MKYKQFYHEESIGYCQVEEDVYEERVIPEIHGIQILLITPEEREKIEEYCDDMGLWHISDLVYFDTVEDKIQFLLTWS